MTELSWLRTLSPAERGKAYLHSYDKNAQWLSAAGVVELGLSGIEERRDPAGTLPFDKKLPGYWLARIAGVEERWACTPTVAWALERGQTVTITQAVRLDHTQSGDGNVVRAAARGADGALRG